MPRWFLAASLSFVPMLGGPCVDPPASEPPTAQASGERLGTAGRVMDAAGAVVWDAPYAGTAGPTLAMGTEVRILATGQVLTARDEGGFFSAAPRLLIRDGRGNRGWVAADRVAKAIRVDEPFPTLNVFDAHGLDLGRVDFNGDGSDDALFVGSTLRYELDLAEDDVKTGPIAPNEVGMMESSLVAVREGARVDLAWFSGWGSSKRLRQARVVDFDADGRDEWLIEWSTTTTEVGYTGIELQHVGLDETSALRELGTIFVQDPRRNGLGQDTFEVVDVAARGVVRSQLKLEDCGAQQLCLSSRKWSVDAPFEAPRSAPESVAAKAVMAKVAEAGMLYADPEGSRPIHELPLGERVTVEAVYTDSWGELSGPFTPVRVVTSAGVGWVASRSLTFEAPAFHSALFGDADEVARTDWVR